LEIAAGEEEDGQNAYGEERETSAEWTESSQREAGDGASQRSSGRRLRRAYPELEKSDDRHREAESTEVVACFDHSARLPAECAEGRQSKQDRYEKRCATEGEVEMCSPPCDETTFISTAANDIGAHEGEKNEQNSE
jgi:hypothetical protein